MNLSRYNKLWVALSGFAGTLVALGVLEGTPAKVVTAAVSAVTAAGVFVVANQPAAKTLAHGLAPDKS